MKLLRIKYLQTHGLFKSKIEFSDGNTDNIISSITNFHQNLKGRRMKDQVGQFLQYYSVNLLFQKLLLVKDALIL